MVANFQALDHTLWPKLGDTRDSKEAFVLHGRDMMAALCEHYAGVLEGAGRTKEAAVQEYRLYKTWARTRETSARETYLTLLKRGMCQCMHPSIALSACSPTCSSCGWLLVCPTLCFQMTCRRSSPTCSSCGWLLVCPTLCFQMTCRRSSPTCSSCGWLLVCPTLCFQMTCRRSSPTCSSCGWLLVCPTLCFQMTCRRSSPVWGSSLRSTWRWPSARRDASAASAA